MKVKSLLWIMLIVILSACSPPQAAQGSNLPHADPEIQALIGRTLGDMVFVEGGSFMMGDPGEELAAAYDDKIIYFYLPRQDSRPAHKVTLDSYYMSRYEITFGEHDLFSKVTGRRPTMADDIGELWRGGPNHPAGVNWQGAHDYCAWLGEQTGLPFALPTEAQWEYAARSRGKVVPFATDTGLIEPGINYPEPLDWPLPVGQFPPNPLGFHDMSGNAYEWVSDWYDPEYYSISPGINPQGPPTGEKKVYRGGGVGSSPGSSSTVIRGAGTFEREATASWGFRCVINTDQPLPVSVDR
ncbi:formylglycine-generating enzyme family protein [Geoalkalibacter halelectricus]|uniref:Formylglycine-generating enzyme family protein n=1 Tax=Geoalkalibacter halelectricus TaxID=2847045 RepID=A0ABY5ZNX5_9BACT|nr:formylglycine-generating enzyme family protein [Geoalkalibacter halelectricus]MDO3378332.1 formylglycine-generating enzyme family protein [Geoalkalibacter halelectricus]UWZ80348.1 formylglycine-generating enzyme family protein [Geoalkalibacter halelectricus]